MCRRSRRRADSAGYTRGYWSFDEADQYTEEEAKAIVQKANFVGLNEAMVPIGEYTLDGERKRRS